MATCFICNNKLFKEQIPMSSGITQYSKVPYPEKIVELMGKEFVVIATPSDHICRKCELLLNHMDKMEHDLNLVKNTLLSFIHKKFDLLPAETPVNSIDVDDDHLIAGLELEVDQNKVPNKYETVPMNDSMDVDNDHLIAGGELQVGQSKVFRQYKAAPKKSILTKSQNIKSQPPKTILYTCAFCIFESKDIGVIRTHLPVHTKEINEKNDTQIATPLTKKLLPKKVVANNTKFSHFKIKSTDLDLMHQRKKGISTSLFNEIKKGNVAPLTSVATEPLMITEINPPKNEEIGGQEGNLMDKNTLFLNNFLSTNETKKKTTLKITGSVQHFTKKKLTISGYEQKKVKIDLESLLAAMRGN